MSVSGTQIEQEKTDLTKMAWNKKPKEESLQRVTVTDINIPFISLVSFLVKLAIAAIPAAIIVTIFWMIIAGLLAGFIGNI